MSSAVHAMKKSRWPVVGLLLMMALLVSACGGGGDGSVDTSMSLNTEYVIGQETLMQASSDDARIVVVHDYESDVRYVTLVEGSAVLFGDYTLR